MKLAKKYSHLNGEEYLIVHHNNLYKEILDIINIVDAEALKTKVSEEKTKMGKKLYAQRSLIRFLIKNFQKKIGMIAGISITLL